MEQLFYFSANHAVVAEASNVRWCQTSALGVLTGDPLEKSLVLLICIGQGQFSCHILYLK